MCSEINKFKALKLTILRFQPDPKIKQLTTKKSLQEQPCYKQSIKKPRIKTLKNYELLRELSFYNDINISRKERAFRGFIETYKLEVINNKILSDLLDVRKNSIKKFI